MTAILPTSIFNISSLNSKMTRYDPNTVPIMQHWSKWPFHAEERKKKKSIQHLLPLFFHSALQFSACISSIGCSCSLHICVYNIYQAKCCLSNQLTPAQKAISSCPTRLILLFTSMLYFSLCLFVFASHLCPPSPVASPRQLQDTPAMLNPRSRDRWRKRGQTSLPISWGAGLGAIIMANSSPAWPREQEKKRDGKSEIGTMPKHISLQDLSWFGVLLDTLHFLFDW